MKLSYIEQGQGPAVILMHGMFGSLSNLGNLARDLIGQYRVISVDLRNHGDSPHEDAMSIPLMADDIVELMDDLGLAQSHLVGHSLGGKLGMHVALHHPDRVSSLLVADIAPVNYPQSNNNVVEALSILDTQAIASRRDADQAISALIADKVTRGFILKNLQRDNDGGFSLKLNVKSIVANYSNSLVDAPSGEPFSGPTLFIKGETSAYIQEKHRPLIAQLFPASEVQVILGAGHWLHAEKPEEFNRLVIEFLSAHQ
jgi:esterase